jgi:hypothetical protein
VARFFILSLLLSFASPSRIAAAIGLVLQLLWEKCTTSAECLELST